MEFVNLTLGIAFLAGLASFLSPCVFVLVPAYIGYLGGAAAAGNQDHHHRWVTFTHGLAFVAGFSMVFVTLGAAASWLGRFASDFRFILTKVGGVIVILFGLHMIGVFRIGLLAYDTRSQKLPDRTWGYLSSVLMGVIFSAGWSPCVGPVLGSILTMSFNGSSISQGALLLSAYSAGLAIPFLLAALGIGWVVTTLRNFNRVLPFVEKGMGALLVLVGVHLLSGRFGQLAQLGQSFSVDFGL